MNNIEKYSKFYRDYKSDKRIRRWRILSLTGFTIIEFLIVIAIIVILTVAAVIPIMSTRRVKLDGAVNKLMIDLKYSQQLSISRQVPCGVSFDIAGNSYFIFIGSTATKAIDPVTRDDLEVNYNTDSEYRGVSLVSTGFGSIICFNYMGVPYKDVALTTPLGSGEGTVVLGYGPYSDTVYIEPNTGEVKM